MSFRSVLRILHLSTCRLLRCGIMANRPDAEPEFSYFCAWCYQPLTDRVLLTACSCVGASYTRTVGPMLTTTRSYVQYAVETIKITTRLAVWFAPSTAIISEARKTLGYFTAWNVRSVTTTTTGTSWQFVAVAYPAALS